MVFSDGITQHAKSLKENAYVSSPLDKNVFFLFLNQNKCCGYSKESSHWEGSIEHPKHMLKMMDKKILTILR